MDQNSISTGRYYTARTAPFKHNELLMVHMYTERVQFAANMLKPGWGSEVVTS
jgi:hypothetical protein